MKKIIFSILIVILIFFTSIIKNSTKDIDSKIFNIKEDIRLFLRYDDNAPAITTIEKISKPGKRVYVSSDDIPRVLNGLGISIISSSKGVVSNKVAKKLNIGGELLCNVW